MPKTCTVSGVIAAGDAVCVVGWDAGPPEQPIVARASRLNLLTSKTVLGVALEPDAGEVEVLVAGDVAPNSVTGLNPGGALPSRIIATDITQDDADPDLQCRLVRVDRPDGSEHVVGTCDENGNLGLQPRASLDTSARHMVNVLAYGARGDGTILRDISIVGDTLTADVGTFSDADETKQIRVSGAGVDGAPLTTEVVDVSMDGSELTLDEAASFSPTEPLTILWKTDNREAIKAAIEAIPPGGGTLFFPGPGLYVFNDDPMDAFDLTFPERVELVFDDGAMLVAASATATIEGRVTAHPLRQIFAGAGWVEPVEGPMNAAADFVTVTGDPASNYEIKVTITQTGDLATARFTYSVNNNADLEIVANDPSPIARNLTDFAIPGTGLTLHFADPGLEQYTADDEYDITAHGPFALAPSSFEHLDVMAFGVVPNNVDAGLVNAEAFHLALGALRAGGNAATNVVARGKFYFDDTLHVCQTVALRGSGRQEPADGAGAGASGPGTWFVFPRNKDGIHIYSGYAAQGGGDHTQIRDLTVAVAEEPANEGQSGNGITLNAIATLDHVTVKFFGGHGIFVSAGPVPPAEPGVAGGFVLDACVVGRCRGDGFHIVGGDANVGLINACNASFNRGFGFCDRTIINTYVACHGGYNTGLRDSADDEDPVVNRNYAAWGVPDETLEPDQLGSSNNCIYLGCYSEGDPSAVNNQIGYGATIIGGALGYQQPPSFREGGPPQSITDADGNPLKWAGWINSSNHVEGQPIVYPKPIVDDADEPIDPDRTIETSIEIGQQTDYSDLTSGDNYPGLLNFRLDAKNPAVRNLSDSNLLRYREDFGFWFLEKGPGRSTLWIPADVAPPRRLAPLFPNGILLSTTTNPTALVDRFGPPAPSSGQQTQSHTALPETPAAPVGVETWEAGDIAWNAKPDGRGPLGWRCTRAGSWSSVALTLTADVDIDGDDIAVTFKAGGEPSFEGLALWAYVEIDGAVVQIVSLPTLAAEGTVKVRAVGAPPAEDVGLSVAWSEPVIMPFGNETILVTDEDVEIELDAYDFHVDCLVGGVSVLLPAAPTDGIHIEVQDALGNADAMGNEITIKGNGKDIDTAMNDEALITTPYAMRRFRYNASADRWFSVGM